jgi:hypothetical protein
MLRADCIDQQYEIIVEIFTKFSEKTRIKFYINCIFIMWEGSLENLYQQIGSYELFPRRSVQEHSSAGQLLRPFTDFYRAVFQGRIDFFKNLFTKLSFSVRVPNRPLFQRTVLYFNQMSFIFIEPIKDAKCPLFLKLWWNPLNFSIITKNFKLIHMGI